MRMVMTRLTAVMVVAACGTMGAVASARGAMEPRAAAAQPGKTVDLRPQWKKGAESRMVLTIKSKNTVTGGMAGGDAANEQVMDQEITIRERVLETDPEQGATVEMVYERIKFKMQSDAGDVDFDSGDPNAPKPGGDGAAGAPKTGKKNAPVRHNDGLDDIVTDMITPSLKQSVGTRLTVKFDNAGRITSVDGGGGLSIGGMLAQVGPAATPEAMASLFGPISSTSGGAPSKAAVGDRWSDKSDLSVGPLGGVKMATDYSVQSVSGGVAKIVFTGRVEPKSAGQSAAIKINRAEYNGQYQWDAQRGRLKSAKVEQVTDVSVGTAGGASMKSTATTTVERK